MLEQIPDAMTLWQQIQEWGMRHVTDNDFLVAGLVGGAVMAFRGVPGRIYNLAHRFTTFEITANTDDAYFVKFNEFLMQAVILPWAQRKHLFRMKAGREHWESDSNASVKDTKSLSPGYGTHFGWYRGLPAMVTRNSVESDSKTFKETVTVTIFGRSRSRFDQFVNDALTWVDDNTSRKGITVYRHQSDYWYDGMVIPRRGLDTIFTDDKLKATVVTHIQHFIDREQWYVDHGIPYHTGVFLHGEPGCGKSSFIHALASHFDRDICYLNLGAVSTDASLSELMNREWKNTILVIEDIDAMGRNLSREGASDNSNEAGMGKLTISGLLNALDGLTTPHGLIVIATTNHLDKIDPAILRKGRFDLKVEVGRLQYPEFQAMGKSFGFDVNVSNYEPITPVTARNLFIENTQETLTEAYEEVINE